MRHFAILLIFFLSLSKALAFVEMENRQPLAVEDGYLTPFWAQEYIGADLVKEEMRSLKDLQRVPFAIYDEGFEKKFLNLSFDIPVDGSMNGHRVIKAHHGTAVATIINGQGMASVSEAVDYVQLRRVSPDLFYLSAVRQLQELKKKPWIISNSMGWPSTGILDLAKEVDQMGIIWVMASGNEYPEKIAEHEYLAPVISVGSYSPRGLQARSSQQSDRLRVLAPSDEYLASIDGNGLPVTFGGTSGATPLVSGSIANMKSLIPTLTRTQIENLIQNTSIKAFHSYYMKDNTAGLFDAYKLFKVTQRLKDLCHENVDCLTSEINNKKNYIFASENLSPSILSVCTSPHKLTKDETNSLRRNFLLNAGNTDYAKLLSCAYKNEGYGINADFYENITLIYKNPHRLQEKIQKQAAEAVLKGYRESAALRDPQLLDHRYKEALLKALNGQGEINEYSAEQMLKAFENSKQIQVP